MRLDRPSNQRGVLAPQRQTNINVTLALIVLPQWFVQLPKQGREFVAAAGAGLTVIEVQTVGSDCGSDNFLNIILRESVQM